MDRSTKVIFSCISSVYLYGCSALEKDPSSWIGKDKIAHFSASAAISAAALDQLNAGTNSSDCNAAAMAVGISLTFGVGKELYDKYRLDAYYSPKDMIVNLLGATTGALLQESCL